MINNKKCAAIVLNYNDASTAIAFIESVIDYNLIDHIIIVDNKSTDDSMNQLNSIKDKKVHLFQTDHNGGYGYGNNCGIEIAYKTFGCEIAFICNSDIAVDEDCMSSIAKVLISNENAVVCTAIQINGFTNEIIPGTAWNVPSTFDYIRSTLLLTGHFFPKKNIEFSMPIEEVDCVAGAFLGVEIKRFCDIGGYDENVFLFCEESILGARAKRFGYSSYVLTDKVYYHFHSTTIKKSFPKELSRFNLLLTSRRYYLKYYCGVGRLKMTLVDFLFFIAKIEFRIKIFLKGVRNK